VYILFRIRAPHILQKIRHDADNVHAKRREIFLGSLILRYVSAILLATWHSHINTNPHTEKGSHWLAVHFLSKSSSAYFFDSYGIVPLVPDIAAFKRRNCTVWDYNRRQLQGLTINVCSKYCFLLATYTDLGSPPKNLSGSFTARQQTDRLVRRLRPNSERRAAANAAAMNASPAFYKTLVINRSFVILHYVSRCGGCNIFRIFERAPE